MDKYTEPHFRSSALITIDTQCGALDGQAFEIPGTSAALPKIRKVLDAYRQNRMPIVHVVRIYKKDGSNVDLCRREAIGNGAEILLEGSAGCELASEMFQAENVSLDTALLLSGKVQEISDHEAIIYKSRWGAFFHTPLESHLKKLGADTLVFTGCNFPNCPRTSVYEASERDFRIVLVEDAISGLYPRGKQEMQNIGALVANAETVKNEIMA